MLLANILEIKSPIYIRYSYGTVRTSTDESTAEYNIHALIEFFVKFPNFQN